MVEKNKNEKVKSDVNHENSPKRASQGDDDWDHGSYIPAVPIELFCGT